MRRAVLVAQIVGVIGALDSVLCGCSREESNPVHELAFELKGTMGFRGASGVAVNDDCSGPNVLVFARDNSASASYVVGEFRETSYALMASCWAQGDGLGGAGGGAGALPEGSWEWGIPIRNFVHLSKSWNWPEVDQDVPGIVYYNAAAITPRVSANVLYHVKVNEVRGSVHPPGTSHVELTTPDYLRDFTITGSVDCADAPQLECQGVYSVELHGRITAEDVSWGGGE